MVESFADCDKRRLRGRLLNYERGVDGHYSPPLAKCLARSAYQTYEHMRELNEQVT